MLSAYDGYLSHPSFFPRGDSLLYVQHDNNGNGTLWIAYASGKSPRLFTSPWGNSVPRFALARNGEAMAVTGLATGDDTPDYHTLRISKNWGGPLLSIDLGDVWVEELVFSPDAKFLVLTLERPQSGVTWLELLEVSTLRHRRISPEVGKSSAIDAAWGF